MTVYTAIDTLFFISTLIFSMGLLLALAGRKTGAGVIFGAGMICQGVSLALRYKTSFPLLPVYQGPFFLPFAAGLLGRMGVLRDPDSRTRIQDHTDKNLGFEYRDSFSLLLPRFFLVTVLSWSACLFPNDFYLPFLQFKTIFAHLFFLLGVAGKALFLSAGILAGMILGRSRDRARVTRFAGSMNRAVLWGFLFWTLSVFSGAAWSWLGWGAPVVWDDPGMTTTMAAWLFYVLGNSYPARVLLPGKLIHVAGVDMGLERLEISYHGRDESPGIAKKAKDVRAVLTFSAQGRTRTIPMGFNRPARFCGLSVHLIDFSPKSRSGIEISLERFIYSGQDADIFFTYRSPENGATSKAALARANPLLAGINPLKPGGRVYSPLPHYSQSGDKLDEILTEISAILHPECYPGHALSYFRELPDTDAVTG